MDVDDIGTRTVLCSVSGGKDSMAMALHLIERGVEFTPVFMDTGWEHPDVYTYLSDVVEPIVGPITRLCGDRAMVELIRHKAMFPSQKIRFCTVELKVKPIRNLCVETFLSTGERPINTVGIRRAESRKRAKMDEWDEQDEATIWRPIIAWTEQDVIDIHTKHSVPPNPLYLRGASRVGCWPCIYARKREVKLIADTDPERITLIRELEDEITIAADARAAAKGKTNQNPRTFFQGKGPERLGGKRGFMRIDDAVAWSRTGRGGRSGSYSRHPRKKAV